MRSRSKAPVASTASGELRKVWIFCKFRRPVISAKPAYGQPPPAVRASAACGFRSPGLCTRQHGGALPRRTAEGGCPYAFLTTRPFELLPQSLPALKVLMIQLRSLQREFRGLAYEASFEHERQGVA